MPRSIFVRIIVLLALFAAACAPSPAPVEMRGGHAAGAHPVASGWSGRHAHGEASPQPAELRLCTGASGRHLGPIQDGAIAIYTPLVATKAGALLRNPTDSGCVTSGFGPRPPIFSARQGGYRDHRGLDIARPESRRVFAAGDGRVTFSGWNGGFGLMVKIDHGRGVETVYAHLDPSVDPAALGAQVRQGDVIGRMGTTGRSTGVHLHYEIRVAGEKRDPLRYGSAAGFRALAR